MSDSIIRCDWANSSPKAQHYHDNFWGATSHDDRTLFKMLVLESAQAGLSWSTVLNKMDAYEEAFDGFDPQIIAEYDDLKVESLMQNPGIIRNRQKINGAVHNARAYFTLCEKHGSLDSFVWSYVGGQPIIGQWEDQSQVPNRTPLSDVMSKDLKKFGFKFVGSIMMYSFLQAVGVVNDHLLKCQFRRVE
jgi:DNA-3-methyladenine glycosylase I